MSTLREMASREFDVIIFGATGYAGRYVIEELSRTEGSKHIKWAVAGRNIQKLKESLDIVQGYLGDDADLSEINIIRADVKDAVSIVEMCRRSTLILNCVGPYKFYGEMVVKACIESGTHHVDISAETEYLETIQAKYFKQAQEKGVYIIEACGFDSIPGDYGISLLKGEFPGDLNAVEYFVEIGTGSEGRSTNIGTFSSAIHSFRDLFKTKQYEDELKKEVFKKDIVNSSYRLHKRNPPLFYSSEVQGWCLWFFSDERLLRRSQHFRYEYLNERPIQSNCYLHVPSVFLVIKYLYLAVVFGLLTMFSYGRHMLEKYPAFFTGGEFSSSGPTRKQVLAGTTKFTLCGSGWEDKLADCTDQHSTQPDTKMKLTIRGPEPAYVFTSMCMVQAGITILQERDKLPLNGGVLTPGVAFENTSLRQRLEKRGIVFTFETI